MILNKESKINILGENSHALSMGEYTQKNVVNNVIPFCITANLKLKINNKDFLL